MDLLTGHEYGDFTIQHRFLHDFTAHGDMIGFIDLGFLSMNDGAMMPVSGFPIFFIERLWLDTLALWHHSR